jgi:anti-sigma factor RsiW
MRRPRLRKKTARPPELTCRELVRLVTDYLEGSLSETDVDRFDAHLTKCDACTTYLAQIRETIRIAGTLTEASLAPQARDELLAAFRTWKHERPAS